NGFDEWKRLVDLVRDIEEDDVIGARIATADDRPVVARKPAQEAGRPFQPVIEPQARRPVSIATRRPVIIESGVSAGSLQNTLIERGDRRERIPGRLKPQAESKGEAWPDAPF